MSDKSIDFYELLQIPNLLHGKSVVSKWAICQLYHDENKFYLMR